MPNEPEMDDARKAWQSQEEEKVNFSLDEIRRRVSRFERDVRLRNLREYVAGALLMALLAPRLWMDHGARLAPTMLLIAGTCYVMYQLYRRGNGRGLPAEAGITASLEYYLREMERQRDALRSVWRWYLLPFVPGMLAFILAEALDRGINGWVIGTSIAFVVVFVGAWALNNWAARRLDRRIREIRRSEANDE